MKPEVQQSLTVLVDNLPKLAEMVTMMTKAYDFAQGIATDKVLIHEFAHGIGEFVKPVQDKAKGIAQAAIEAGERTQADAGNSRLVWHVKNAKRSRGSKNTSLCSSIPKCAR